MRGQVVIHFAVDVEHLEIPINHDTGRAEAVEEPQLGEGNEA